jgi:hypothetical protein
MKFRLLVSFALMLAMFGLVSGVAAQSYSFSLDQETVNVYWNADGSIAVDYVFAFTNDSGGHVIDYVDVGMPNGNYGGLHPPLATPVGATPGTPTEGISADVGGAPVSLSSDYQGLGSYGFAVDMGSYAIQPGQSGSLHVFVGRITGMVYPDTDKPDTMVSGEFSPTWFGSAYVHGSTNLTVIFHLPPGVLPQEPTYHPARGGWPCSTEPVAAYDEQNRITYTWACSTADGSSQYTFGLSFPKQYVPADVIVTSPTPSPLDNSGSDAGIAGIVTGILGVLGSSLQGICCGGFFLFMFVGVPILGAANERRRKLQYLPPKIQIEGHGIKRGLTAVEAAILMEQPLDRIMTMILFGVVKKNAATVVSKDPLKLDVASPLPADLHEYELEFLKAFSNEWSAKQREALQEMTINLVKSVSEKMKGFSRKETVAYYQSITERAWQQVEAADTPEVKSQMFDESLEWTMLDKNYDERTRRVFTGPIFVPMWWGRYDPGYRPASASTSAPTISGTGGRASIPGASFAASVITGVQGFSSRVLGNLQTFTSGVTNKTNPPPPPSKSSGGGFHGGGGCACACACAGCACACAGGGR